MKSTQVKAFLRKSFNVPVSVTTIPCKAKWVQAEIIGDQDPTTRQYTFRHSFPEEFRRCCMRAVYPNSTLANETSGGNVGSYSITMLPHEWDLAVQHFSAGPVAQLVRAEHS